VAVNKSSLLAVSVFFAIFAAIVIKAAAQAPSAPGSGHGFLIDKHLAAGVNCVGCHANAPPPQLPAMTVCMDCHGSYQQIAPKTASDQPNPHASHLGDIPCASCHHVHKASETFCDQCHSFGMTTP
jgi:fumarate reductase flavoprotein subunit